MIIIHFVLIATLLVLLGYACKRCYETDGKEVFVIVTAAVLVTVSLIAVATITKSLWPILAIGFMFLAMSYIICHKRRMVRTNLLFGMTALGVLLIALLITYGAAKNSREVINVLDMLVDDAKNSR